MQNYYPDILNKRPLTKPILWKQIQGDCRVNLSDVTPEIKEQLASISERLIKNRDSMAPTGVRFVNEMKLRREIGELFKLDIDKDFEKVASKLGMKT